jgi:hypothetical protein
VLPVVTFFVKAAIYVVVSGVNVINELAEMTHVIRTFLFFILPLLDSNLLY